MRVDSFGLDTSIEEISGIPVVRVAGEIDVFTAPEFKAAINQAIATGATNLVIDLNGVSYMDSSGFGTLLAGIKRVKPKGGSIHLVGCSEAIERMLRITRLDSIFEMYPSLDEAVSAAQ